MQPTASIKAVADDSKSIRHSQCRAVNPHSDINLHQVLTEIVPGAVGPVARPGIDMLTDPITQQGLQITVDMVVAHQAEAADIAFQVEDKFWSKPQAEANSQERFKILVVVVDDQGAVLDRLMFACQRKSADVDGDGGDLDRTQNDSHVLVDGIKPGDRPIVPRTTPGAASRR
jgi:hypothetical protein